MQMTENEIVKSYKQATKKVQQIGILADLNLCTKKEIRAILESHGCEVPHYGNRYTKPKETSKPTKSKEPNKPEQPALDFQTPVVVLVQKRLAEIDFEMKPLETRLEALSIEYNALKNWLDLVNKVQKIEE